MTAPAPVRTPDGDYVFWPRPEQREKRGRGQIGQIGTATVFAVVSSAAMCGGGY